MLKFLLLLTALAALPSFGQQPVERRSLIPPGVRAIATPDDSAIILIYGPTDPGGSIMEWLGIGAIACDADNSLVVWYEGPVRRAPQPQQPASVPDGSFLWPEGIEDARPFDIDNSIVLRGGTEEFRAHVKSVHPSATQKPEL